jgi:hypothetical protein
VVGIHYPLARIPQGRLRPQGAGIITHDGLNPETVPTP